MSKTKILLLSMCILFAFLWTVSVFKKRSVKTSTKTEVVLGSPVEEIALETLVPSGQGMGSETEEITDVIDLSLIEKKLPSADRIEQLFTQGSSKLPIVETVVYTSRVPWLSDRPAWVADYAAHFSTSRHFIARSLNKSLDYFSQKISPGDRFNVFKKDLNIEFYLVIDLSRCMMWFYYLEPSKNERVLLKTYEVGVGRKDVTKPSESLTPLGKYRLGDRIAIYKPGIKGYFQDQKIDMISVFGTRWIPFEEELAGCTEPAKGFGIHGAPWIVDPKTGEYKEDRTKIGRYDSDGCIRLKSEDIEELFAIIITKPTTVELVKDFFEAHPPGIEKE